MSTQSTDVATQIDTGTSSLTISDKPNFAILGIVPRSVDEMFALAERVAASGLVPKTYIDNPGAVLVAWQMGAELGLAPMQAVQCIAVINGMPSVWGNGRRALVKAHRDFEWQDEQWDPVTKTASCTMKRRNQPAQTKTFSWADAQQAMLDKKDTYKAYPREMCGQRAHARCTDAVFPDAVKGLRNAEDVIDLDARDYSEARPVEMPQAAATGGGKINDGQHRLLRKAIGEAAGKTAGKTNTDRVDAITAGLKQKYGIEHGPDLRAKDFDEALTWVNDQTQEPAAQ